MLPKTFHSRQFRIMSIELQRLFVDLTSLAWRLNDARTGLQPKINDRIYYYTVLLHGYRLVNFSPLNGPRPTSGLENAIHLGLTAFIMTLFLGFDFKIKDVSLASDLARAAVQGQFDEEQEGQKLLLWVLFMGGASIFSQADDVWLNPKIASTMHALDLHTWQDVSQVLAKFPWVHATHDKAGQALWCRSAFRCRPQVEVALNHCGSINDS